ncbi:Holliday junction resolvase RuvX [Candidatus Falkowbacteria bacterium]|nr:Holliday junction resolvase RuvX [Candidatus Falkowbacteria bacterium]
MKRYLGIDFGTKRIGLALGDSVTKLAMPFKVVADLSEVVLIVKDEGIDKIIVGLPHGLKGNRGQMVEKVEVFIEQLRDLVLSPIETVDERLSSKAGDALIGGRKDKAPRDAIAAMLILQSYFDKGLD